SKMLKSLCDKRWDTIEILALPTLASLSGTCYRGLGPSQTWESISLSLRFNDAKTFSLAPFVTDSSLFRPRRICRPYGSTNTFFDGGQGGALVRCSHLG